MRFTPAELAAIREIFFVSSSRQKFASEEEREKFFETWTGYYFKNCADLILLDRDGETVRGYLMGCADSTAAKEYYSGRLKSYALFEDLFSYFPAHLHINVSPAARSQGVGARLIERFVGILRERKVPALHIVTSPDAANLEFYRRNGFGFEVTRPWGSHSLLFMGKKC